jgi:Protein of unknown function (DUF2934)
MNDIEQRIRERTYRIWLDEGCPQGRELDHWDMAAGLVAIEDGQRSTLKPVEQNLGPLGEPIEPIEAVRNAGEFPTLTNQGEGPYPAQFQKQGSRR